MSVVVGIVDKNKVYLGSDRQISTYNCKNTLKDSKIFIKEQLGIGVVGNTRIAQIIKETFYFPAIKVGQSIENYIVNDTIPMLQKVFDRGGVLSVDEGVKSIDSIILIGIASNVKKINGRLFVITTDFQVVEVTDEYSAIGSGEEFALGSLYTTAKMKLEPKERINYALEAANKFNLYVGKPFDYIVVGEEEE